MELDVKATEERIAEWKNATWILILAYRFLQCLGFFECLHSVTPFLHRVSIPKECGRTEGQKMILSISIFA